MLGLVERRNVPQVIATDMHITQGGVEIRRTRYLARKKQLVISMNARKRSGTIYLYLPPGFVLKGAAKPKDGLVAIEAEATGQDVVVELAIVRRNKYSRT